MSPSQRDKNTELDIIAQATILIHFGEACELSGDNVSGFINQYRETGLPKELSNRVSNAFNYLSSVTNKLVIEKENNPVKKRRLRKKGTATRISFLDKTNIVMLAVEADKAIKNNINEDDFTRKANEFFRNVPSEYKNAKSKHTADESSVRIRMESIDKAFNKNNINITNNIKKSLLNSNAIHSDKKDVPIFEDEFSSEVTIPGSVMNAYRGTL
jgi:hypothetical protein